MKKLKKTILTILVMIFMGFGFVYSTSADSGWDSSYGGGGFSSGSSWGGSSGSSWGSSYGSSWGSSGSYSGSGSSDPESAMASIIIYIVILVVIAASTSKTSLKATHTIGSLNMITKTKSHLFRSMTDAEVNAVDSTVNLTEFKTKAFEIYRDIQTAWMNFDTDTIRNLATDELYNMYSSQLETLKLKGQKNIMKDILLEEVKVVNIKNENKVFTMDVYLRVNCYDYVIKESTNEVLRGRDKQKLVIEYLITYVKTSNNNKKTNCPNCGAEVTMNASHTCPFCESVIVKDSNNYVMSKKTCVSQHMKEGK